MSNAFCSNCGAPLSPGAKFCGKCGTAVSQGKKIQSVSVNNKPSGSQIQDYIYILPAQYKKGMLSTKACSLIFTRNEVLVAMVDNKLMQQHIASVRETNKGEKFFKRAAAAMKAGYTFSDRYRTMQREEIVSECPGSFTIPCNTVQLARFSKGTTTNYSDDTTNTTPPSLALKTNGGKFVFTFNLSVDTKSFIPMLLDLFAGRYKGPKR